MNTPEMGGDSAPHSFFYTYKIDTNSPKTCLSSGAALW